jgi:Ca2+-binding RTX toxin-like protein
MVINLEAIEINGLLVELAYLELENNWFSINNKNNKNIDDIKEFLDSSKINNGKLLSDKEYEDLTGIKPDRIEEIIQLLDKYEIVKFASDDKTLESDFQGMLLKDKISGDYIVSFRGTASLTDAFVDIAAGILNINAQYNEAKSFVENILKELKLSENDLTLTGHSLGGILTQQVGASLGIKGYAYNPWGASTLSTYPVGTPFQMTLMERIFGVVGITDPEIINFAKENILNVSLQDAGLINGDILSNFLTGIISEHLGEFLPLFYKDVDLGAGHSIITMNKVLEEYNQILSHFIQETTYFELSNAYLLTSKYINGGYDYVQKIFTELDIYSKTQLQLNIVENINYEDILNSNDNSKLYALINQIPFTISSSSVDLYQNFDISNMSQSELNDRGLMYEYIINNTSFLEQDANYINNDTGIKLQTLRDIPTVIFGSNDETKKETIYTQKTNDRIYAGKGDDTIIAWGGNNLYDGGEGNDTVSYKTLQSKEGITLNLSLATAQAINSTTTDTLINVENVIGSRYDDFINFDNTVILKDKKIHILEGYDGSDKIYGAYNSVNVIYGNTKEEPFGSKGIFNFGSNRDEYGNIIKYDDWLYGGKTTNEELLASGNLTENHLYGGSGDDFLLVGYNAHNYLYGGAGEDTLVSAMIGFKNEKAGIDFSYGSSYLNGGEGFDTYSVKDYVTIEDDDGRGEIQTKYGKLQDLTMRTFSDGRVLLLKNNPQYISVTTTSNPLAGYSSVSTQGMLLDNYELVFKLSKDGNDLILDDLSTNPTVIRIKNYTANSLSLNITQNMFNTLPNYDENNSQTPTPVNPILTGTNEVDTLMGSEVNNTFISNAGDDILKDISGGNDIYKFKKGDGADTIYDIKGNDTIIFDESVLKEDITFSQSDDLKSLIINYSATDSITITNYFDSFSKIENIQLSTGEKLIPEFNTQTIGSNQAENLITGYGNDTVTSNAGNDTIKDLNGNDTYIFKVGDGNDTIEDLDGIDKIVFENLSNDDLIFTQKDNNLIIHYSINDSVTILNYFDNTTSNYLEKIAFKNDLETIDASNIITGTINDDEINGTYFDDVITSNKGNDTLKGFYGKDGKEKGTGNFK